MPLSSVHRYLVAWVPKFVVDFAPKNFGVTHAMDRPLHVSQGQCAKLTKQNFSIMHGPTKAEESLMRSWIADYVSVNSRAR